MMQGRCKKEGRRGVMKSKMLKTARKMSEDNERTNPFWALG
jgi:hypothetical protein